MKDVVVDSFYEQEAIGYSNQLIFKSPKKMCIKIYMHTILQILLHSHFPY